MANFSFERHVFTSPPDGVIEIFVNLKHIAINVRPYDGAEIRIEYCTCARYPYSARSEGGVIMLECPEGSGCVGRGGMLNALLLQLNAGMEARNAAAQILIPRTYRGMLNLCTAHAPIAVSDVGLAGRLHALTSRAPIRLRGVIAAALELSTSNAHISVENAAATGEASPAARPIPALNRISGSNSRIAINGLSVLGRLECMSFNGSMSIKDSAIQGELDAGTANGALLFKNVSVQERASLCASNAPIRFSRLLAQNISLATSNGGINGSIVGRPSDFTTECHTTNGRSNIPDTLSGTRQLAAHTSNGNIHLSFVR